MKLLKKTEQKLLGRTRATYEQEVIAVTPSRKEIQQTIAKLQKVDASLVAISSISSTFGSGKVTVIADIYKSADDYKKAVPAYLAKKSVVEAPVATESAETAKEETKEEKTEAKEEVQEDATQTTKEATSEVQTKSAK